MPSEEKNNNNDNDKKQMHKKSGRENYTFVDDWSKNLRVYIKNKWFAAERNKNAIVYIKLEFKI